MEIKHGGHYELGGAGQNRIELTRTRYRQLGHIEPMEQHASTHIRTNGNIAEQSPTERTGKK